MAVQNLLSLLADGEGNIEHADCFVQQQLDLKRKIHRALRITCFGGLNGALCELVCVIDKIGDASQGYLEAAIHIAAHVLGLTVGSSQNGAESNTSGFHASSKDDQRWGNLRAPTILDRRVPGVGLWRDREGSSGTRVDLLNSRVNLSSN
jgi:hypothetical protein